MTPNQPLSVINQFYDPGLMPNEYFMRQNAAIIRCSVPSFVADFVYVVAWVDSDGKEYVASENFSESKGDRNTPTNLPAPNSVFSLFGYVYLWFISSDDICVSPKL